MSGGLLQLVAVGAQDGPITGNPQNTFFKIGYKRFSPYAEESIEQTFNGPADFGKRVTCTISRNADLIKGITLQVTLPQQSLTLQNQKFRWLNYVGFRLVKKFEVEVGGQLIDRQYGEWLYIWHQLSTPPGSRRNLEELVGNSHDLTLMKDGAGLPLDATCAASELTNTCVPRNGTPAKTLYIPLSTLWFCRNPGLALPLIALQYHEVKINIEFANFSDCAYWEPGTSGSIFTPAQSLVAASLYVDYVYLDTDERRATSQRSHEYLIEQLQQPGGETITSSVYKAKMNFNHPCKALYWVVQRDSFVQCSSSPSSVDWIEEAGGAQPFNYTDEWSTEGLIMDVLAKPELATTITGGTSMAVPSGTTYGGANTSWYVPNFAQNAIGGLTTGGLESADTADEFVSGTTNYLLAKLILESGVKCEGKNPVEVAKITLNGHDRFSEREGRYFDKKQVLDHHTSTGATGINMYSFCLKPEEWQPSGSLNFSRIDTAHLHLTLSVNTVRDQRTASLRIYAVNYNFFRVTSGMGGLAFAS
jgi:hypothetical protein